MPGLCSWWMQLGRMWLLLSCSSWDSSVLQKHQQGLRHLCRPHPTDDEMLLWSSYCPSLEPGSGPSRATDELWGFVLV